MVIIKNFVLPKKKHKWINTVLPCFWWLFKDSLILKPCSDIMNTWNQWERSFQYFMCGIMGCCPLVASTAKFWRYQKHCWNIDNRVCTPWQIVVVVVGGGGAFFRSDQTWDFKTGDLRKVNVASHIESMIGKLCTELFTIICHI